MKALIVGIVLAVAGAAFGQTSAFTYQGQLKDNGSPANGTYDMAFRVWDAAQDGQAVSPPLPLQVAVSNGLFTSPLDFGTVPFQSGSRRWLEISVNNVTLQPRQEVTPTPYSLTAAGVVDNAITTPKLTDAAVTNAKVATGAISNGSLATAAVDTAKLANGAVTSEKIEDTAVSTVKLADGAVTTIKIAPRAVTNFIKLQTPNGVSTTSPSFTPMPGLVTNVTTETDEILEIAFWSADARSGGGSAGMSFGIFIDGVLDSVGGIGGGGSAPGNCVVPIHFESIATLTPGQHSIDVRWAISSGTASIGDAGRAHLLVKSFKR